MTFLKKFIGDKAFYKMAIKVTLPIMLQNLITNFVSLLDNLMVGNLGTEQMSGVSIVNQLLFIFNLAIFGAAHANKRRGNRVITSAVEHPSVMKAFDRLENEGFEVIRIPTDKKGFIDIAGLEAAVNENTVLISIMAVNNEIGTINPINQIKTALRRVNSQALIHVDAIQGFGKLPVKPAKMGIDLLTVSGHKVHAPKGVGALYVSKNAKNIKPVIFGGGQENALRSGTENTYFVLFHS